MVETVLWQSWAGVVVIFWVKQSGASPGQCNRKGEVRKFEDAIDQTYHGLGTSSGHDKNIGWRVVMWQAAWGLLF